MAQSIFFQPNARREKYLDIVFHNLQKGGKKSLASPNSYQWYSNDFPREVDGYYAYITASGVPVTLMVEQAWLLAGTDSENICGANQACAVFFCESGPYPPQHSSSYNKDQQWSRHLPAKSSDGNTTQNYEYFFSTLYPNPDSDFLHYCAYFDGFPDLGPTRPLGEVLNFVPENLGQRNQIPFPTRTTAATVLSGMGTGKIMAQMNKAPNSNEPGAPDLPGSPRYGIVFQVATRRYPKNPDQSPGDLILGLFVHIKNTHADPGTQIAALCRLFPDHIIFGDLNLDIHEELTYISLQVAIGNTHVLKYHALQTGNFLCVHIIHITKRTMKPVGANPQAH